MSTLAQTPPSHTKTRDLAYIALMAALMAICSWITIPFSLIPFTLQTFAVFAALSLLGGKRGSCAILLYLCLGLVGLPVFSGFSGGVGALLSASGGYLIGFLGTGLAYWAITARFGASLPVKIAALVLGTAVCYAFGTLWFIYVYTEPTTWLAALAMCVFPFIPVDLVKMALALLVTQRVGKVVNV